MTLNASPLHSNLDLTFQRQGRRTILTRRLYSWPYTVSRGFYTGDGSSGVTIIVQSGSGTVNSGDSLTQWLHAGPGARVRIAAQGAMSVHRADNGVGSTESVWLSAEEDAWMESLAEPRILFPGSQCRQRVRIQAEARAGVLSVDAFVMHPISQDPGTYQSETEIVRSGVVVARDVSRLSFPHRKRSLTEPRAHAIIVLAYDDCDVERAADGWRDWYGSAAPREVYGGVTALPANSGLSLRIAARDGRLLRDAITVGTKLLRASSQERWR